MPARPAADDVAPRAPLRTIEIDRAELTKCTPGELHNFFGDLRHAEDIGYLSQQGSPKIAWAAVDLDKYTSIADFVAQARQVHKGNGVRDTLKAQRLGYYPRFFDFRSFNPDVVAINRSSPVRQGRPMTPYMMRSVEESGGYPTRIEPPAIPGQAATWVRGFGLFRGLEGHRQGEVVTDEQLVAYVSLRRLGNFAFYGAIIGHADHLADGIMYKMHFDLIGTVLRARDDGPGADPSLACLRVIRYIGYADFYGIRPGLLMWKKRGLFEPVHFQFDYLAPCWVDRLCAAAEFAPEHVMWQEQCAAMLAEAAKRCVNAGRHREAAMAQTELAAVLQRLASMDGAVA